MRPAKSAAVLALMGCLAAASVSLAANPYKVRTIEVDGRLIDEIIVPGRPPEIKAPVVKVPRRNAAKGINTLAKKMMTATNWSPPCHRTTTPSRILLLKVTMGLAVIIMGNTLAGMYKMMPAHKKAALSAKLWGRRRCKVA